VIAKSRFKITQFFAIHLINLQKSAKRDKNLTVFTRFVEKNLEVSKISVIFATYLCCAAAWHKRTSSKAI
jgi:hypothetical protein